MNLILTNSLDATADYLTARLADSCVQWCRIDTDRYIEHGSVSYRPGRAELLLGSNCIEASCVTNVWYRRPERIAFPGTPGSAERAFTLREHTEALEGFLAHVSPTKWINHPTANARASQKIEQLTSARRLGLKVPDTILTNSLEQALEFYDQNGGHVVAKPISDGQVGENGGGDFSLIYTNLVDRRDLEAAESLGNCPTLFQQYIDKMADVRVTVLDGIVHAVALKRVGPNGKQICDIRRDNMLHVHYARVELPEPVSCLVHSLLNYYGLRFAALDFVIDFSGSWYFLEVNPNGQWAWLDQAGVTSIGDTFLQVFTGRGTEPRTATSIVSEA